MKNYIIVYKLFQKPGIGHETISAENKNDAKMRFKSKNIKHDSIIRIII